MIWVQLRRDGERWRVNCLKTRPDCIIIDANEAKYLACANATVTRLDGEIKLPLWQLELAKYATQNLAAPLGAAFDLADAGQANPNEAHAIAVLTPLIVVHAVTRMLAENGERVAGMSAMSARTVARFVFGTLLALGYWIVTVIRYARRPPKTSFEPEFMFAIYGDLSNRTQHLLPPKFDPGPSPYYMILGRPHKTIEAVARIIDPTNSLPEKTVFRAISWGAALKSLPRAVRLIARGLKVVSTSPASLPLHEYVAIAFRFMQGACEARWWREQNMSTKMVAFGLTGLAETTLLEWAIQEGGAKTIHCVHGSSLGWNFAAYSDIGLFSCGHDADLATKFPAYKFATSLTAVRVEARKADGGRRWLVMTSYTHLMNPQYIKTGAEPDLAVLDMVQKAAQKFGQEPGLIVWKPHPIIKSIDPAMRAKLEDRAAAYGFKCWPKEMPYSEIAGFGTIMTTPSTAAIDALKYGKLPILLAPVSFQPDIVYGALPLIARNDQELEQCMKILNDPVAASERYQQAWKAIRPGDAFDHLQQLEDLQSR